MIPYLSPPAWASAATGVNPGRHGIYDFHRLDPDSMVAYFETAKSRRSPSVWALLSDAGRRVGILNIPLTDTPEEVNGFLVAGMPHGDSLGYAYPGEVETELHHEGYRLDRMGEALIEGQRGGSRARDLRHLPPSPGNRPASRRGEPRSRSLLARLHRHGPDPAFLLEVHGEGPSLPRSRARRSFRRQHPEPLPRDRHGHRGAGGTGARPGRHRGASWR